jgi:hypothetical protein
VARRERGVVEEPAAGHDARRLRVVHRHVRRFRPRRRVDDRDRVVEPRQHIEPPSPFVEDEARGTASAHLDVARRARHGTCRSRALPWRTTPTLPCRTPAPRQRGSPRCGSRPCPAARRGTGRSRRSDRRAAAIEVDVLVQVPRGDAAPRREHGDPALVQVPAQAVPPEDPGAFEPIGVVRFGVGDLDLPAHGIDGH